MEKIDQMTPEQVQAAMAWVAKRIEEAHAGQQQPALPAPPSPEDDADVRELQRHLDECQHLVNRVRNAFDPVYSGLRKIENRERWPWPATCTQLLYLKDNLFDQVCDSLAALRRMCIVIRVASIEGQKVMDSDAVSYRPESRR